MGHIRNGRSNCKTPHDRVKQQLLMSSLLVGYCGLIAIGQRGWRQMTARVSCIVKVSSRKCDVEFRKRVNERRRLWEQRQRSPPFNTSNKSCYNIDDAMTDCFTLWRYDCVDRWSKWDMRWTRDVKHSNDRRPLAIQTDRCRIRSVRFLIIALFAASA